MSCRKISKLLPLHVGGDLDLRDRAAVEGHLQRCLSCYREFSHYREDLERLQALGRSEHGEFAAPSLAPDPDAFLREVMGEVDGPPPVRRLVPRVMTMSGWAAAAVLLGLFLVQRDRPQEGPGAGGPEAAPVSFPAPSLAEEADRTGFELVPMGPETVQPPTLEELEKLRRKKQAPHAIPVNLSSTNRSDF